MPKKKPNYVDFGQSTVTMILQIQATCVNIYRMLHIFHPINFSHYKTSQMNTLSSLSLPYALNAFVLKITAKNQEQNQCRAGMKSIPGQIISLHDPCTSIQLHCHRTMIQMQNRLKLWSSLSHMNSRFQSPMNVMLVFSNTST